MKNIINRLKQQKIDLQDLTYILRDASPAEIELLFEEARKEREKYYGKMVFVRGLIEFTNYCKNNCYYCGIRRDNSKADRYRLNKTQILECCQTGYSLGYRTFVLQGGEDGHYKKEDIADLVSCIHISYPDCAITLSVGEHDYETYKCWYDAGATRYLLRHETASEEHYQKLHPMSMSLDNRKDCLYNLKKIGYQTGAGFMVGSPYQTLEYILEDLNFLITLQPAMIGIGPFIAHKDTPFADFPNGTLQDTVRLLAIIRLLLPAVLLPATTALGTIAPTGREQGILAGANVVMPNLSPVNVREKYSLYNNKICTGEEAAECRNCLETRIASTGYEVVTHRGDSKM